MASAEPDSTSWRDEDTLRRLYWDKEMTQPEIAEMFGCNQGTISYYMRKFGIERRDNSEVVREATKVGDGSYRDEETLRELYWDREMTITEIADKLGVGLNTIHNWMKKHHIERRAPGTVPDSNDTDMDTDFQRTSVTVSTEARDHAKAVKNGLGLTWSDFLRRAADDLDPDT